jgi:redox-sensing transcriptional repressor
VRYHQVPIRPVASRNRKISETTVRRLSLYLRTLEELESEGTGTVSSRELAIRAGTTAAQVRKDLSHFGSFGKRGLGYSVTPLRGELREILGLSGRWRVGLVGAGRIGSALFEYPSFRERGFRIVTVLDRDPAKVGKEWNGVRIRDASRLEEVLREEEVELVILAVPSGAAQPVVDRVVAAGIRGILNLAPVRLEVPPEVVVNDVDMAVELEALSFVMRGAGRASAEVER